MAVDIAGFGDARRAADVQLYLRRSMYQILDGAFNATGLDRTSSHLEDRGDGVLVVLPPTVPPEVLLDPLTVHMVSLLRQHNRRHSAGAQLRLRMAVHAGRIHADEHGVSGRAVIDLFRLLDGAAFRRAAGMSTTDLSVIVSDQIHSEVISTAWPDVVDLQQITVTVKETRTRAWIWIPPQGPAEGGGSTGKQPTGLRALLRTVDTVATDAKAGADQMIAAARQLADDPRETARIAALAELGDTATAFYRLAELAEREGDLSTAEEHFRRAAQADYDDAAYRLANVLYRRSRGPDVAPTSARSERLALREEAEQWYLQAAQSGIPQAWRALGDLYRDNGRLDEMERCYNRAGETESIPSTPSATQEDLAVPGDVDGFGDLVIGTR
ncbi:hypothetical protein ACGFNU_15025 [Spirillospora sp. NPDC048911]|uniref:hypothetical protein n=1 Tax=Spirillospora sp. NPDC048911 TaxID=3364527 RepID=UPI003719989D